MTEFEQKTETQNAAEEVAPAVDTTSNQGESATTPEQSAVSEGETADILSKQDDTQEITEPVVESAVDSTSEVVESIGISEGDTDAAIEVPSEESNTTSEVVTPEQELTDEEVVPPKTQEGMNWFVLRVASNKEDYVRGALEKKVQIEGVESLVGRIMVPTEKTKTLTKTGKAKITETKLYPGYIFVEMRLVDQRISQDVFFLIKETTGVGDFVGTAGKPTPMSDEEVDKMLYDSQAPEEVTEVKLEFMKGDHVSVKDGPFMGHEGTVDEIYPEKGVVRVLATVFGRQTPLDIEYWMIEKAE